MSSSTAKTDRESSIDATEFVWDGSGETGAHRYLAAPICARLAAAHARTVLDLGCGNGAMTARLAARGYDVAGCDYSLSGLDKAREALPGALLFRHDLGADLPASHIGHY